jgi:SnoaL-like polyketide cyclase
MNMRLFHKLGQIVILVGMVVGLVVALVGCVAPIQDTRSQTNIALSDELHKNFSENHLEANLALADENIEVVAYAFGMQLQGKDQFAGFMRGFKTAFPDIAIHHTNVFASGDQVMIEFEATGTHTGPLGAIQ